MGTADFVTIPFATNYEVNQNNEVRKKGGKLLNRCKSSGKKLRYLLVFNDGIAHWVEADSIYSRVISDIKLKWYPIPSTGGLYECTRGGRVRNSISKRVFKKNVRYHIKQYGKTIYRSRDDILWEVFGKEIPPYKNRPVGVTVIKNGIQKSFPSLNATILFLAEREHYSHRQIYSYMVERRTEIYGWQITYKDPQ